MRKYAENRFSMRHPAKIGIRYSSDKWQVIQENYVKKAGFTNFADYSGYVSALDKAKEAVCQIPYDTCCIVGKETANEGILKCYGSPSRVDLLEQAREAFAPLTKSDKTIHHVTERIRNAKGETIGIKYLLPQKKNGGLGKALLKWLRIIK